MTLKVRLTPALESRLRAEASARGEDVETFIRRTLEARVQGDVPPLMQTGNRLPIEDFDAELSQLTFEGPALPGDYSRADIYNDHA